MPRTTVPAAAAVAAADAHTVIFGVFAAGHAESFLNLSVRSNSAKGVQIYKVAGTDKNQVVAGFPQLPSASLWLHPL